MYDTHTPKWAKNFIPKKSNCNSQNKLGVVNKVYQMEDDRGHV